MHSINYSKYTANGNNFVILDEIRYEQIPETKKSQFSQTICNEKTGIGCDTLIIVQKYNHDMLKKIYGVETEEVLEDAHTQPAFIMRVFERDGSESYNCGNGLICLGHHLQHNYLLDKAAIATEIPSTKPFFRSVKSVNNNIFRATLGNPSVPDDKFLTPAAIHSHAEHASFYRLKEISVAIQLGTRQEKINFSHCYVTFTGEPHVVIFEQDSLAILFAHLFASSNHTLKINDHIIQQIGLRFNALKDFFPQGININFAKRLENGKIAYRCFERGVNKETFACGTGAVAVASVAKELNFLTQNEITILPWRARYETSYQNAEIIIQINHQRFDLLTQSRLLAEGTFYTQIID